MSFFTAIHSNIRPLQRTGIWWGFQLISKNCLTPKWWYLLTLFGIKIRIEDKIMVIKYSPDRQWCPESIHTLIIESIHTLLIESIHTLLIKGCGSTQDIIDGPDCRLVLPLILSTYLASIALIFLRCKGQLTPLLAENFFVKIYFKVSTKGESIFYLQEDRLSFVLTLK